MSRESADHAGATVDQGLHEALITLRGAPDNSSAWRIVEAALARYVFAIALKRTGDVADAEDVKQETFYRLMLALSSDEPPTFESANAARAYVARIASNRAMDLGRRRKVREEYLEEFQRDMEVASASPDLTEDETQLLDLAAPHLNERDQLILELLREGRTNGEIASAAGLTPGAAIQARIRVPKRVRRILIQLGVLSDQAEVGSAANPAASGRHRDGGEESR